MSIKRLNYFNHQFLDEKDFRDEQNYHLEMRRNHNHFLHFWGVVDGLQVVRSGNREVTIEKGFALDREGRELIVTHPITREVPISEHHEQGYLAIGYKELLEEADRHGAGGVEGFNRLTETVEVHFSHEMHKDHPHVVLAHLHVSREGHIHRVDESARRQAGSLIAHQSVHTHHLVDAAVTEQKLAPSVLETLRPKDFYLADGSVTMAKLSPELQLALSSRGWVRMPFKPNRLRPKAKDWGAEMPEFQLDVAYAYSDLKGARGTMEIPVPPGAIRIREFRIAGTARRKVRVQLLRTGWDIKQRKGESTEIMNKEIIHGVFDSAFEADRELDEFHAITVSVAAEGEAEIWLVAARFE
jgi:hypothetical protein